MKKMFLAFLVLAIPSQAWAGGCGCGSVQAIVTAAKMETIQTVNAYTAAEAQAIRSEILLAAQNIIGTIKTESATIVRAILALKESNVAAIKGQAVAGEALKTEDMYGKAAQPAGLCGTSSLGAGIQLAAQAGQEIHTTMREKQFEYANREGAKPVEFLERVLAEEHLRKNRCPRPMNPSRRLPIPGHYRWSRNRRRRHRQARPTLRHEKFMRGVLVRSWKP